MKWFPLKRRLLPGLKASKSQPVQLPVQHGDKFDEETGQVYTENYIPIPSGSDQDWTRQRHDVREWNEKERIGYHPVHCAEYPVVGSLKGARSLQDIALDSVLKNIGNITLDYLQSLPSSLVDRIWVEFQYGNRMGFDDWKTFSKLLQNRDDTTLRTMRYREAFESPRSALEIYTSHLTSVSYEFITILSITTAFQVRDLVKLCKVPNLGVLEIVKTSGTVQCVVGDRLIRAWSMAAVNDGAFKVLRMLRLWNQIDITSKSLVYLNSFPALGVYDVRGCGFDLRSPIDARRLGWAPTVDNNILHLLGAACVERAVLLREKLGKKPQPIRRASAEQLWDGAKVRKIPRGEVAAHLTRDQTSKPGTPRKGIGGSGFFRMSEMVAGYNYYHPEETVEAKLKMTRWDAIDRSLFWRSREKMTWECQLYSAYARLGELRDDRDLKRAGIDTEHQAMVGDELINSVPMVSIRLGPTSPELRPTSAGHHKSTYGSVVASNPSPGYSQIASHPDFSPKNLCFTRVELPSESEIPSIPGLGQDKKTKASDQDRALKRKSILSIASNKKMKLSDVLGSFL